MSIDKIREFKKFGEEICRKLDLKTESQKNEIRVHFMGNNGLLPDMKMSYSLDVCNPGKII